MLHNYILLLPSFTCLFWGITFLCSYRTNSRLRNIWIAIVFFLGVSTFIWSVYFGGVQDYALFYKLEVLEAFSTLLLIPLLYFGYKALTNEKPFGWKDYLWLVPAPVIGISLVLLYAWMGEELAVDYIRATVENKGDVRSFTEPVFILHNIISIHLYKVLVIAQIVYVLVYATVRLVRYRHRLNEFFSTLENKSMEHQYALLAGLYLVLILSLVTYRGRFYYDGSSPFVYVLMIIWAALIYFVAYNVSRLKYTADNLASDIEQADSEAIEQGYGAENPETDAQAWSKTLRNLLPLFAKVIDEDRVFLQSDLRIDDVARMMCTNRTYISHLINERFQCTFSEYINGKRIEYARELILSDPNMTQEQLAAQSGFLHASSFSRTFKRQMGITFREWLKRNTTEIE